MPTPEAKQDCPDLQHFQRLASSLLGEADKEALLRHLEGCERCAGRLSRLPEQDPLAKMLRQAQTVAEGGSRETIAALVERLSKLRPRTAGGQPPAAPAPARLFSCPACGKGMKIPDGHAGKQVKCPYCKQVIRVPTAATTAPAGGTVDFNPAVTTKGPGKLDPTIDLHPQEQADNKYREFLAPSQAPDELGRLGPYRVLKVLGSGGMGVVFRAEDPQLMRPVALKAMLPTLAVSEDARQRFLREARAAAAIRHDHIVSVYQVGEDRGVPFLAMEFLEGESLDERLERERKLPAAEVVRVGREIALGLAAAHKRGLVHRDIKPANVWLEAETGRVKILDFGLARAATEGGRLTQLGAVVGTPGYMAPEQAQGKAVDHRCDLFSLGCVLYRMATGRPSFRGTDLVSTIMAVCTHEPPPPHKLEAMVPVALSNLIMKLLAKEPAGRPPSAEAVAETLERIAHEPIAAAAAKPRRRRKWPLVAGAAGLVLVGLLVLWAAGVFRLKTKDGTIVLENVPANAQVLVDGEVVTLTTAEGKSLEIRLAPGKKHRLRVEKEGFKVFAQDVGIDAGGREPLRVRLEPLEAAATKDETVPRPVRPPPSAELTALRRDGITAEALAMAGGGDAKRAPANLVGVLGEAVPVQTARISRLAFSPDGRWLASASFDATVLLRDVNTGRVRRVLRGHDGPVSSVAFSKDGQTLVSAGQDGTLKLWPTVGDGSPQTLLPKCGPLGALAASPDGRFLAAGGKDGTIKLWKWGNWDRPLELPAHPGAVSDLAFAPDGEMLAVARIAPSAGADGQIRLYQTADGKAARAWVADKRKNGVHALAFHPDGKWLASAGQDNHVRLWEVASGKLLGEHGDWTTWSTLALHPGGKTLYACLAGTNGVLFDLPAVKPADGRGRKHGFFQYGVVCSAFSPDGKSLAAGTVTGMVHVWDAATWEQRLPKHQHSHYVTSLAVSPDGRTVLTTGDDNTLRRWDVTRPRESRLLHGCDRSLGEVAASPDGRKYVTTAGWAYFDAEQRGRVWDAATGEQLFKVDPPTGAGFAPVFSRDGKVFAGLSHHSPDVHLWSAGNGREVHRFLKAGGVSPAFNADGKRLATAAGKSLQVWDVATGDALHSWEDDAPVVTLTLSADGRSVAAGHADGTIGFWDLAGEGRKKRTLAGHTARVTVLRFTPDGHTLISSGDDGTIRLWDPERQRSLREIFELGTTPYPPEYFVGLGPMGQTPNRRLVFELDASGKYLFAAGSSPLIYVLRLP